MQTVGGLFLIGFGIALAGLGLRAATTDHTLGDGQRPIAASLATVDSVSPAPAISAVVTLPPAASSRDVAAAPQPAADMPSAGPALVRELQRELARVGCYDGAINGAWTEPSRQALRAFIEHVNAKLPTGHAEFAHLALVRGHAGQACGACPAGEEMIAEGRCVAAPTVARLATGAEALHTAAPQPPLVAVPIPSERPRKTTRSARRAPPIEGRMSIGTGVLPPASPPEAATRLAYAPPEVAQPPAKQRRAARQRHRALAHGRPRHLRATRPGRFAFRPFRRSRGGGLFFGLF
jgi:hypothetical protein